MQLPIYFNSHMRIDKHTTKIISKQIHVFIQDRGSYKHKILELLLDIFFRTKYLRQPSIDACNVLPFGDLVYNERW